MVGVGWWEEGKRRKYYLFFPVRGSILILVTLNLFIIHSNNKMTDERNLI